MRATVRLANGSVVEGEVVSIVAAYDYPTNACAAAPPVTVVYEVPGAAFATIPRIPPPTAACAAPTSTYWIATV